MRVKIPFKLRRKWLVVAGLVVVAALFVAVFPARTYLDQRRQRQEALAQIKRTDDANKALEDRIKKLNTDAEVERLAREQYNLVRPGEEAYAILPTRQPAPAPAPTKPKAKGSSWWDKVTSIF